MRGLNPLEKHAHLASRFQELQGFKADTKLKIETADKNSVSGSSLVAWWVKDLAFFTAVARVQYLAQELLPAVGAAKQQQQQQRDLCHVFGQGCDEVTLGSEQRSMPHNQKPLPPSHLPLE